MRHETWKVRDPSDGTIIQYCSCGYSVRLDRGSDNALSDARHKPPQTKEPPLKVEGFVSGLPDRRR